MIINFLVIILIKEIIHLLYFSSQIFFKCHLNLLSLKKPCHRSVRTVNVKLTAQTLWVVPLRTELDLSEDRWHYKAQSGCQKRDSRAAWFTYHRCHLIDWYLIDDSINIESMLILEQALRFATRGFPPPQIAIIWNKMPWGCNASETH